LSNKRSHGEERWRNQERDTIRSATWVKSHKRRKPGGGVTSIKGHLRRIKKPPKPKSAGDPWRCPLCDEVSLQDDEFTPLCPFCNYFPEVKDVKHPELRKVRTDVDIKDWKYVGRINDPDYDRCFIIEQHGDRAIMVDHGNAVYSFLRDVGPREQFKLR